MVLLYYFFCDKICQNHFGNQNCLKKSYQRVQMIDILLKYILWYDCFNDLDAQTDFDKKNCHKQAGQVEPFLS